MLWHLTDSAILLHNIKLGNGFYHSISYIRECNPELYATFSQYEYLHRDKDKEKIWEYIRKEKYPHCPSRLGAMFFFLSTEDAEIAVHKWNFSNRIMIGAELCAVPNTKIHEADSEWLNEPQARWPEAAHCYWQGKKTDKPIKELIVHGTLFFPNWDKPPFGFLEPN